MCFYYGLKRVVMLVLLTCLLVVLPYRTLLFTQVEVMSEAERERILFNFGKANILQFSTKKEFACVLRLNGVQVPSKNSLLVVATKERFKHLLHSKKVEPFIVWDCTSKESVHCQFGLKELRDSLIELFETQNVFVYDTPTQKASFPLSKFFHKVKTFHFSNFRLDELF